MVYEAKPLLATPVVVPRRNMADYYPQAIGFDAACLHPPPLVVLSVPLPASSWAPASNVSAVEHPEMSTGPTATGTSPAGSLAVTIAATEVIGPVPPLLPAIPATVTEAYQALFGTRRSVGVAEPKRLLEALRAAQAWVQQSLRYASMVCRNQTVKEALATILDEKAQDFSTSMAADMDNFYGPNLTDAKNSSTGSSVSARALPESLLMSALLQVPSLCW